MKTKLIKNAFMLFIAIAFIACKKEEKQNLTISNVMVENHDGGSTVKRGGTISVNFDAIAGEHAKLDFYHIEIHDHPSSGLLEDEYKIIDNDFKEKSTFKGLRNAHVHEHITVPNDANLGEYHAVIVVVDSNGNSVDTENARASITVVE